MTLRTIGVVGAGTMGNGIAHVFAQAGFNVILNDIKDEFVAKGMGTITKNLQRNVDKGRATEADRDSVLARITCSTNLNDLAACDLVVEAIIERLSARNA